MLNIPETVKALYKRDGVRKNFRAHFPNGELPDITNENLVQESVKFTESVCSQDIFKFGLTEASVIEFETVGVANMYGMTIECSNEIECSSLTAEEIADIEAGTWDGEYVPLADSDLGYAFFRVPYGVFQVDSCPRNHEAMAHRKVTAYSADYSWYNEDVPNIPETMSVERMNVNPYAFLAQVTRGGLSEVTVASHGKTNFKPTLYDSLGAPYIFDSRDIGDPYEYGSTLTPGAVDAADFMELLEDIDINACRAFGNDIADQLTTAGYDLTYNASKQKIYRNNREALENAWPYLFGPALTNITYIDFNSGVAPLGPLIWQRVLPHRLYPMIYMNTTGNSRSFIAYSRSALDYYTAPRGIICYTSAAQSPVLHVKNGSAVDRFTITPTKTLPIISDTSKIKGYQIPNAQNQAAMRMPIENTGAAYSFSSTYLDSTNRSVTKTYRMYSFIDAFDRVKIINSLAELGALFGRVNRLGGADFIGLDNNSPLVVAPGEYLEFWWDEFDVEPIGAIRYSYDVNGETEVLDYTFSSDRSIYDMSDNLLLGTILGANQSAIIATLNAQFIPNITGVNFVPIDLSMKGLPYIEAADALAITAEDGTTVNSYALRIEISGIQALTAQITSQSGLIIGSEEQ